jgi:hypothetical protein
VAQSPTDACCYAERSTACRGGVREFVDLGGLKGNKGTQQYELPVGLDLARYGPVVVWCRAFSVAFGSAALSP